MMSKHLPGVHLPAWDLRGCSQPARSAIIASQIREQVFSRLSQRYPEVSCVILSKLALIYDQARWWITHQQAAEACLGRLLSLRRRHVGEGRWRRQVAQESTEAQEGQDEGEGGSPCAMEAD